MTTLTFIVLCNSFQPSSTLKPSMHSRFQSFHFFFFFLNSYNLKVRQFCLYYFLKLRLSWYSSLSSSLSPFFMQTQSIHHYILQMISFLNGCPYLLQTNVIVKHQPLRNQISKTEFRNHSISLRRIGAIWSEFQPSSKCSFWDQRGSEQSADK